MANLISFVLTHRLECFSLWRSLTSLMEIIRKQARSSEDRQNRVRWIIIHAFFLILNKCTSYWKVFFFFLILWGDTWWLKLRFLHYDHFFSLLLYLRQKINNFCFSVTSPSVQTSVQMLPHWFILLPYWRGKYNWIFRF